MEDKNRLFPGLGGHMSSSTISASPIRLEGLALLLVIVTTTLGTSTFALVGLRVWFRLWLRSSGVKPNACGWDDFLAGVGVVSHLR